MMLHLHHAAEQGHTKAYLRTVDSDVVVLAINLCHDIRVSSCGLDSVQIKHTKIFQSTTSRKCLDLTIVKH